LVEADRLACKLKRG